MAESWSEENNMWSQWEGRNGAVSEDGCNAFLKALEELKTDPLQMDQSKTTAIEIDVEGLR